MLRYEYKYFVPNSKLDLLRDMIKSFVYLDKFAASRKEKEYTVRSIYFETPDFECYRTKIAGLKHRNKVRLRGYNKEKSSNTVFLEIKRKYEAPILKNRAPVRFDYLKSLFNGVNPDLFIKNTPKFDEARDNARRFLFNVHSRKMKPVVNVIYEREPFLSIFDDPGNNLRVTFDKNLRSCPYPTIDELYDENRIAYANQGYFILEVKFNNYYPAWMKPVIAALGLRQQSASKYCLCIDAQPFINPTSRYDLFSFGRFFGKKKKKKKKKKKDKNKNKVKQ
ncbi:MAG: polyphosphate polymerase domain-containing protein [Bacteroidota bacterium]